MIDRYAPLHTLYTAASPPLSAVPDEGTDWFCGVCTEHEKAAVISLAGELTKSRMHSFFFVYFLTQSHTRFYFFFLLICGVCTEHEKAAVILLAGELT
jgi:hypothetical protein